MHHGNAIPARLKRYTSISRMETFLHNYINGEAEQCAIFSSASKRSDMASPPNIVCFLRPFRRVLVLSLNYLDGLLADDRC